MKRKYGFLIVSALLVCISLIAMWSNREQPMCRLLPAGDMRSCASYGYYDGMESVVAAAIPQENIKDLFDLTTVKKGTSSKVLPSACFEIRALYGHETYIIVVGADKSISVASIDKLESQTFWIDTSGKLFENLYRIHIENGGTKFP